MNVDAKISPLGSKDHTKINIEFDPHHQRMKGYTREKSMSFDVPFISEIAPNLFMGGCRSGLLLPKNIKHLVSLYVWERYSVGHEMLSSLSVEMYDSHEQEFDQVEALAAWVNVCRAKDPVLVHCFPDGTQVGALTPIAIEKADSVFGIDGVVHGVTYHHLDPFEGNLRVINSTGALPLRSTPEHVVQIVRPYYFPSGIKAKPGMPSFEKVKTVREHYESQPMWVEAKEVIVGDYLVSPKLEFSGVVKETVWPNTGVTRRKVGALVPNEDTAWMLGFYAADGGTVGENAISFCLSLTDDVDRLVSVWCGMGLTAKVRRYENYTRITVASRTVSQSMREWFGSGIEKRLPEFLFSDGWPLASVVEGYADGDGYEEKSGTVTCHSISYTLIEQIRMCLNSLGEFPTVSHVRRHSGFDNANPSFKIQWASKDKTHHTAWWRGKYLMPVTSIEEEHYSGVVHNLAVEDVETYTVNGVLVHNCQAGFNRSGLVVATALIRSGMTATDAIQLIRQKRSPAALCNQSFENHLLSLDV